MEERFVYSVRGRGYRYGEPVERILPNAFVMGVAMDKSEISTAPGIREAAEVAGSYLRAAVPALVTASYLRSLGYEAVAHIDGESELVKPPLAEKCGFGKIGRHGLLVSKAYGSLLRLSAVTTDAPLATYSGGPEDFPLEKACEACNKCAAFCPANAIPEGSIIDEWGNAVRNIDHEACFDMWTRFGTDCGVCIAACPYNASGSDGRAREGSPDFLKNFMFDRT